MKIKNYLIILILLFFFVFANEHAFGQDKKEEVPDSLKMKHSPGLAALMSAVVPGAGQFYNKRYWKIPIIYGGFASLIYMYNFYGDSYQDYRQAYLYRTDNNPLTIDRYECILREDNVEKGMEFNRKYRDFSVIIMALWYAINIVDASVDGNLYNYDVSDDLSLRIDPVIRKEVVPYCLVNQQYNMGVKLSVKF